MPIEGRVGNGADGAGAALGPPALVASFLDKGRRATCAQALRDWQGLWRVAADRAARAQSLRRLLEALGTLAVVVSLAASTIVFREPAPYDVLMAGTIVFLALFGLAPLGPLGRLGLAGFLLIAATGFIATIFAADAIVTFKYNLISGFLAATAVAIAGFVAADPVRRGPLLLNTYQWACVFAALCAVVGYFDLVPGAGALFSKYGRASGTFKDPNVLGAALVPAALWAFYRLVTRPAREAAGAGLVLVLVSLAVLLSFSRGAWLALAAGIALVGYGAFVTAPRERDRQRLLALAILAGLVLALAVAAAVRSPSVRALLIERASFAQLYDLGPEGRFGGQLKAFNLVLERPLGLGALTFGHRYHHEEPHNVYLNMFLNGGWLGGFAYLALVLGTLAIGLGRGLAPGPLQGPLIVASGALAAMVLEGVIIDSDHWRHFYLLLGLIWGLVDGGYRLGRLCGKRAGAGAAPALSPALVPDVPGVHVPEAGAGAAPRAARAIRAARAA